MSCDGSKRIKLHKRVHPDENLKYLIFYMVNRVTAYSKLPPRLRKQVIRYCATVLFYDHGYKDVKGISSLDHTIRWKYGGGSNSRAAQKSRQKRCHILLKTRKMDKRRGVSKRKWGRRGGVEIFMHASLMRSGSRWHHVVENWRSCLLVQVKIPTKLHHIFLPPLAKDIQSRLVFFQYKLVCFCYKIIL